MERFGWTSYHSCEWHAFVELSEGQIYESGVIEISLT